MDAGPPIYVSRLVRLPLLDNDGVPIGRVDDVVLGPSMLTRAPRVFGFIAVVQRRQIFINANRVSAISADGTRLGSGTVDLRRFQLRSGELLVRRGIIDRHIGGEVVNDLSLVAATEPAGWEVATISLSSAGLLRRRRAGRVVAWHELPVLFDTGPVGREIAALREMHPSEVADAIAELPMERRHALVDAMEDEQLADLLEELPEDEQVRLIEQLDVERAADVLEEMEADDAADLLAELPRKEREELLEAMEPDEATPLRRLLTYAGNTAGGLMTPEPLIVTPETTIAEVLARMRNPELPPALAAQVFVVEPPTETPTGKYIGAVGFQRLLREPPSSLVSSCLDPVNETVPTGMSELEVAEKLAAYDAIAIPVCDASGRMVGAVTVDDVLDHLLPADWRERPSGDTGAARGA